MKCLWLIGGTGGRGRRNARFRHAGGELTSTPPQGTGIVNTLLFDIPFAVVHPTFRAIGTAFLLLDIFLFLSFTLITIVRYALYPTFFFAMLNNETHSLFLGTIPMGFVTIVSGIAKTGGEYGLEWTLGLALVLWWIALGAYLGRGNQLLVSMLNLLSHGSDEYSHRLWCSM